MKFKQVIFLSLSKLLLLTVIASALLAVLPIACQAKKKQSNDDQKETIPTAAVYGMAGECYLFYGTGGIIVEQTPRPGMWHSNLKTYKISIDASNVAAASGNFPAANFAAANVDTDFKALPSTAFFVSNTAICSLPSAVGMAGREIMVCNTSKLAAPGTVTYNTAPGETVSGNASGVFKNSVANKVDRFISDGKNWFAE